MKLFALHDVKAKIWLPPTFQKSIADATRSFSTMVNDKDHPNMITQFPSDFRLYHLGEFDQDTGKMVLLDLPNDLGSALDFKAPDTQSQLPFEVKTQNAQ